MAKQNSPTSGSEDGGEPLREIIERVEAGWQTIQDQCHEGSDSGFTEQAADELSAAVADLGAAVRTTSAWDLVPVVDDAWQELCERDDRTSPEEYPGMCLITHDELADFMSRAALSSSAGPAVEAVAVKALEWTDWKGLRDKYLVSTRSDTMIGSYRLGWNDGVVIGHAPNGCNNLGGPWKTMEAAKAAAQAHYETRIRSALYSQPAPATVEMREALEKARIDVVCAIAFLSRDLGTERERETVRGVIDNLVKTDNSIRSALALEGVR